MPSIDVYNLNRDKVGQIDLDDLVFGAEVKEYLFWEVVRNQLANRRCGTAKVKERGEVRGSTRKMFRQKGTGRARQGNRTVNTHRGGGVVFGPRPRDFGYKVPKKVRRAALRSALSRRLQEQRLIVLEDFSLAEIKTKKLTEVLKRFELDSALLVDERNENLNKSARNLKSFKFLPVEGLNVYDVLRYDNLILTAPSVKVIEGALRP
jgi:large subunit ribosomal protein L4